MNNAHAMFCLLLTMGLAGGCAGTGKAPNSQTPAGNLTVPWTGIMGGGRGEVLAKQVLGGQDLHVGREQRSVVGPNEIVSFSAYTTYTYDWEPISLPGGMGFRHRQIVETGVSVP